MPTLRFWDLFWVIFIGIVQQLIGILSNVLLAKSVGIDLTYTQMGWVYSVVILASQLRLPLQVGWASVRSP